MSMVALLFACTPDNQFTTKESATPAGAVDLGIEMTRADGTTYKLYWAKSNLSESGLCAKPEEYGDYYAWGETETKENYYWSTYKWCNGSEDAIDTLTKYNTDSSYGTVDNKTVLDPEDDVAHVKLGGKWRMPTDAEWTELRTQCTWTWTAQNGVNGYIVTSTNGNSIFLPAASFRYRTGLSNVGSCGYYWSSSLRMDGPTFVWFLGFYPDTVGRYDIGRCNGLSVRPVSE